MVCFSEVKAPPVCLAASLILVRPLAPWPAESPALLTLPPASPAAWAAVDILSAMSLAASPILPKAPPPDVSAMLATLSLAPAAASPTSLIAEAAALALSTVLVRLSDRFLTAWSAPVFLTLCVAVTTVPRPAFEE